MRVLVGMLIQTAHVTTEDEVPRSLDIFTHEILLPQLLEFLPRDSILTLGYLLERFYTLGLVQTERSVNARELLAVNRTVIARVLDLEDTFAEEVLPILGAFRVLRELVPKSDPFVIADFTALVEVRVSLQTLPDRDQGLLKDIVQELAGVPASKLADVDGGQLEIFLIDGSAPVGIKERVEDVQQLLLPKIGHHFRRLSM